MFLSQDFPDSLFVRCLCRSLTATYNLIKCSYARRGEYHGSLADWRCRRLHRDLAGHLRAQATLPKLQRAVAQAPRADERQAVSPRRLDVPRLRVRAGPAGKARALKPKTGNR